MPRRIKSNKDQHEFLAVKVTHYDARVDASTNYEVRDLRRSHSDTKIYAFGSEISLEGIITYPEKRMGDGFSLTIYGNEPNFRKFDATLADCHVRDENDALQYRKIGGKLQPVYAVPQGISYMTKQRGVPAWTSCIWVPPHVVTQMLQILCSERTSYLSMYEHKIDKNRWITSLSLQTSDPALE